MSAEFASYLTENRVLSVFSKQGVISEPKQLGQYIKWVLEDAIIDFKKDHPDLEIDDKTAKIVFNGGHLVVMLLKKHL